MTREEQITARRAELQGQLDALVPEGQLPATATRDDLAAHRQRRATLEGKLASLNAAVEGVRILGSAPLDERWLAHLIEWRKTLCDERLQIKSPIRDPQLVGLAQNLELSIKVIDRGPERTLQDAVYSLTSLRLGALMLASGFEPIGADPTRNFSGVMLWFGSMPEVERRITTLAEKRQHADSTLEAVLMSDEERAAQEAEAAQLVTAYNSMNVRVGPDSTCLVAYRNGEVLPPSAMTELQRRAFERADAVFRAEQDSDRGALQGDNVSAVTS